MKTLEPWEFNYDESIQKEVVDHILPDIRAVNQKVEEMRAASEKSDARTFRVAVAALVVSALTLLATVLFGLIR